MTTPMTINEKIENLKLRNANELLISDLQNEMRMLSLNHKIERATHLRDYKKNFLNTIQTLVKLTDEINDIDKEIDAIPTELYCERMYDEFDGVESDEEDED